MTCEGQFDALQLELSELLKVLYSLDPFVRAEAIVCFREFLSRTVDHPLILSSTVLRLCDLFPTVESRLKEEIVRTLESNRSSLRVLYNAEEAISRFAGSLESADPEVRGLALKLLSCFATAVKDNSYVFNLAIARLFNSADTSGALNVCRVFSREQPAFRQFLFNSVFSISQPAEFPVDVRAQLLGMCKDSPAVSPMAYDKLVTAYKETDHRNWSLKTLVLQCMFLVSTGNSFLEAKLFRLCIDELSAPSMAKEQLRFTNLLVFCLSQLDGEYDFGALIPVLSDFDCLIPNLILLSLRNGGRGHDLLLEKTRLLRKKCLNLEQVYRTHVLLIRSAECLGDRRSFEAELLTVFKNIFPHFSTAKQRDLLKAVGFRLSLFSADFPYQLGAILLSLPGSERIFSIAKFLSHPVFKQSDFYARLSLSDRGGWYESLLGSQELKQMDDIWRAFSHCRSLFRLQRFELVQRYFDSVVLPKALATCFVHFFKFWRVLFDAIRLQQVNLLYEATEHLKIFYSKCRMPRVLEILGKIEKFSTSKINVEQWHRLIRELLCVF